MFRTSNNRIIEILDEMGVYPLFYDGDTAVYKRGYHTRRAIEKYEMIRCFKNFQEV